MPSEKRQKLDPKSVCCILVGYEEDAGSWVYQLFDPVKRKVILSRDVIVDESPMRYAVPDVSDPAIFKWDKGDAATEPE